MRRKGSERQDTLLIVTTLSIMLPITLNAAFMEDCKDRLMDVYTKVCGNDRLKRGIEKFDLKKIDRKKFELAECIGKQNKILLLTDRSVKLSTLFRSFSSFRFFSRAGEEIYVLR